MALKMRYLRLLVRPLVLAEGVRCANWRFKGSREILLLVGTVCGTIRWRIAGSDTHPSVKRQHTKRLKSIRNFRVSNACQSTI